MEHLLNMGLPPQEVALRFLLASILGGIIGWPRESSDKPAGLRTHMLVSLGSASFMILASGMLSGQGIPHDPLRVITGIVTGVGFLGAGSIIQARGEVHGITTAAGIWLVAGIGTMCGAGMHGLAIMATLFGYIIIVPLDAFKERYIHHEDKSKKEKDSAKRHG